MLIFAHCLLLNISLYQEVFLGGILTLNIIVSMFQKIYFLRDKPKEL